MDKFITHTGLAVPLDQANIDTDQIIPKQFLKSTERVGFGQHLFNDWRYLDDNGQQENPDFILNKSQYQGASVLITQKNFGCGSSREHAPWALQEYGFKVIIAPSFADIFYANCINIGILPIILSAHEVRTLIEKAASPLQIAIDLRQQKIIAGGQTYTFDISPFNRHALLEGIDSIDWTLKSETEISTYESGIPTWR